MQIQEKWINDFISLGREIEWNGEKIRPETKTSIAIGKIFSLETVGKNNLKAVVKVSGAKYNFTGFLNDNSPVAELIKEAKEKDLPIAVRFEKKRKKGIDPKTPIESLIVDAQTAKDNIVNIVSGVYNFNGSSWILTDDSVSNPDEDPDYVSTALGSARFSVNDFFSSPATQKEIYSPKITKNSIDSKANHLISMYNFAAEHNQKYEINLEKKALKILASYMLKACDQLQMKIYELDTPNYSDYSHTKARGMLFSWMGLNPLSTEIMTTKGGFNEWITTFIDENVDLWEWAREESAKED